MQEKKAAYHEKKAAVQEKQDACKFGIKKPGSLQLSQPHVRKTPGAMVLMPFGREVAATVVVFAADGWLASWKVGVW